MPPGAPTGMPGPPGMPQGMPPGMPINPQGMVQALQRVKQLQSQSFASRATKALRDAKLALGIALQDVALRSPGASKNISSALEQVTKAEVELKKLESAQMQSPPPNLSDLSQPGMPGMSGGIGTAPMGTPPAF